MRRRRLPYELIAGVIGSVALHIAWFTSDAKAQSVDPGAPTTTEVELEQPKPAPEPEPPKPTPEPEPTAQEPRSAPTQAAAAQQAPAAAQAGRTLTAPDDGKPGGVEDFTLTQGLADTYAGGTTASNGTSKHAVQGPVSTSTAPAGSGTGTAPPPPPRPTAGPDRSRGALPGSSDWNCSHLFPNDPEAGDAATVTIVVTVRPDGTPRSVSVLRDPGHGFGSAARSCALAQRYTPALDREGTPTTATTPPITVRFTR